MRLGQGGYVWQALWSGVRYQNSKPCLFHTLPWGNPLLSSMTALFGQAALLDGGCQDEWRRDC